MVVLEPLQILVSKPACAIGIAFTVTSTVSIDVQLFASVTVTVYVVVFAGLAVGCAMSAALSPVVGDHEYVYGGVPPLAFWPIDVLAPLRPHRPLPRNRWHP
jgi:hypothetical protein